MRLTVALCSISVLCLALLTLAWRAEIIRVSDDSMSPSLEDGDILITWKITDNAAEKLKGRIIVFYFPFGDYGENITLNEDNIYIKRCSGCPGDTVNLSRTEMVRPQLKHSDLIAQGAVVIPYGGYRIPVNDSTMSLYGKIIRYELNGKNIGTTEDSYTFSGNYYFAVGDNSAGSFDSRHWGFIPETFLISYR